MASYLEAIQKIPGGTAKEKFQWLGNVMLDRKQRNYFELEEFPPELKPLLRVNRAVKKRIYEDVTWALKSEDRDLVNRALRATWYFDGSHKDVVDAAHFREHIFQHVCLNTRTRIVKRLAVTLAGRDSAFAREMFVLVDFMFGLCQAMPLIVACDEDFIYRTIVERRIKLPYKYAKLIFRRNPDVIVRYLKLSKPCGDDESSMSGLRIDIRNYESLLPKLVKKRLEDFVELYEMHEKDPPKVRLSNTCAEAFLNNGMKYLKRKPLLYIDIVPLHKFNASHIEDILPNLLPDDVFSYNIYEMLSYLKHYPEDKKIELLRKTYKDKYGAELFEAISEIPPELMRLLPVEERVRYARIQIEREKSQNARPPNKMEYENFWNCYLTTEESIPAIKKEIDKTSSQEERVGLIWRLIYTCKVNKDDDALYDVMMYFRDRHKNELLWVFDHFMNQIERLYNISHLNEKLSSVLYDIIRLSYVKHTYVSDDIIIAMIHNRLLHDKSITESIEMLLQIRNKKPYFVSSLSFEMDNPRYEKRFLENCVDMLVKFYLSVFGPGDWTYGIKNFLLELVLAMYKFNDRLSKHVSWRDYGDVTQMTVRDYPKLKRALILIIENAEREHFYYDVYCDNVKNVLRKYEYILYFRLFKTTVEDMVRSGEAMTTLRENSYSILINWENYLEVCKKNYRRKHVQRFVRATRWYADLPIRFMNKCMRDLKNDPQPNNSCLAILAMLIHGGMLMQLIDPLIPRETTVDTNEQDAKEKYKFVKGLPSVMILSNPPVSLYLVGRLCEGDYLSIGLMALTNVSSRSSLMQVLAFAWDLMSKRISVRKHGIRLMYLVAPMYELTNFLLSMWQSEDHHSIRGVLLKKAKTLFQKEPCAITWSVLSIYITTLILKDEQWLSELTSNLKIPDEHVGKYIQLVFDAMDALVAKGMDVTKTNTHIVNLLNYISPSICDFLPDDLNKKLIQKYLFHTDDEISRAAIHFTAHSYLVANKKKYAKRFSTFNTIFTSEVSKGWDQPHPKKRHFYPVNHTVYQFVDDLVNRRTTEPDLSFRTVVTDMKKMFLSCLTPYMDAKSYLLLIYAKELDNEDSFDKYGLLIGQQLPSLVEVFSSRFIGFMAETFEYFLQCCNFGDLKFDDVKESVLEGLIDADNLESYFMVATILTRMTTNRTTKINGIIDRLQQIDDPSVTSLLCDFINKTSYDSVEFDENIERTMSEI